MKTNETAVIFAEEIRLTHIKFGRVTRGMLRTSGGRLRGGISAQALSEEFLVLVWLLTEWLDVLNTCVVSISELRVRSARGQLTCTVRWWRLLLSSRVPRTAQLLIYRRLHP